jgi:hypothetical protein
MAGVKNFLRIRILVMNYHPLRSFRNQVLAMRGLRHLTLTHDPVCLEWIGLHNCRTAKGIIEAKDCQLCHVHLHNMTKRLWKPF